MHAMYAPALTPTNSNPSVWTQPDLLGDRCPNHHLIFSAALGFSDVTVLENGWKKTRWNPRMFQDFFTSPTFSQDFLVGGIPTLLKNMSSSMGRMTSHI